MEKIGVQNIRIYGSESRHCGDVTVEPEPEPEPESPTVAEPVAEPVAVAPAVKATNNPAFCWTG